MLEAVTVSLHYADYLRETLPYLSAHVDRVAVVTSAEDTATHAVANNYHNVRLVITDAFWRQGAVFRKGAAINAGLAALDRNGWLLHMDADCALLQPIDYRHLHTDTLYGARRRQVRGRQHWRRVLAGRTETPLLMQDEPFCGVAAMRCLPPGFFQLWHHTAAGEYPDVSSDASDDDLDFARQFVKCDVLPLEVYHLETRDHRLRANWQGRVTDEF